MEAPSPNQIIKPFNLIIKNNDIDYNIIILLLILKMNKLLFQLKKKI